jgi:putative ABC transport system permease protein
VVVQFMALPFHWQGGPALAAATAAVLLTVFLGLAGTWPALSHKPAPVLRNL